jgi:outer membrane protein assembly factor BamD (BamD/ComL family)
MPAPIRRTVLLLLLLCAVCGRLTAAEWYVSYERAKEAFRDQQWQDVVRLMTEAISEKEDEKAKAKTYGLRFMDYFPYLYRGIAYLRLGDQKRGLADLERSERDGEVGRASDDRDADRLLREALAAARRGGADDQTFAQATQLFRQKEYEKAVEQFRSIESGSSFYAEAQRYIKLAEEEIRKAQQPTVEIRRRDPVAELFHEGVELYDRKDLDGAERKFQAVLRTNRRHPGATDYLGRIRRQRQELAAAQRPARETTPGTTQSSPPRETARQTVERQPPGSQVPRGSGDAETLFRQALDTFNSGLQSKAKQMFLNVRILNPSHQQAGEYLYTISRNEETTRKGVTAYFEGDYAAAIEHLSAAATTNRENARLYGLLASAYAARYLLSGGEEGDFRDRAGEAYKTARELDATYTFDSRYISPRIIAMFNTR